ncbi:MAG: response regulator transcription factor [Chitinophagaceae bacterium]
MNKNVSILIADDHPLLLNGLEQELSEFGYNIIEKVDNGAIALERIVSQQPDIAILDLEMPLLWGFDIIQKARAEGVKTKFIALTYHKERSFILQASKLNIDGYLLKDEPFSEIHAAIRALLKGEQYFSETFKSIYKNNVSPEIKKVNLLTPSERTIIRMIAQGKSSQDIAEDLTVSVRTVQKHRSNIIYKLDLKSSVDPLADWVNEYREFILSL